MAHDRSPGNHGGLPPIPTGVQTLLRLASVDGRFRDELVARRGEMADVAGVALTASERAMLAAIPAAHLREMADKLPPPPPARREMLRQTAATSVVLLGGAALPAALSACCGEVVDRVNDHNPMLKTGGAAPDWPEVPTPPGDDDDSSGRTSSEHESGEPPTEEPPTEEPPTEEPTPERPERPEMHTRGGSNPDLKR